MKKRLQGFAAGVIATLMLTGVFAVAKNMHEKIDVLYNDIKIEIDGESFIATNANGDIVMLVVPGNNETTETPGATFSDMAQIFMDLDIDIIDAINLDGGGSTTMVAEDVNGNMQLEAPLLSGSKERALGNILAIVVD